MSRVNNLSFETDIDTYVTKNGLYAFGVDTVKIDGSNYIYVSERRSNGEKVLVYITDGFKAVGKIYTDGEVRYIYQINPDLVNYYDATLGRSIDHISLSMFSGAVVRDSLIIDGRLRVSDLMA